MAIETDSLMLTLAMVVLFILHYFIRKREGLGFGEGVIFAFGLTINLGAKTMMSADEVKKGTVPFFDEENSLCQQKMIKKYPFPASISRSPARRIQKGLLRLLPREPKSWE
jgi:hypothetical protein